MNYQEILEKVKVAFSGGLPKNVKIYLTISLAWIILIGYLTWWNGLRSPMIDKSFRWDEWFWFGISSSSINSLYFLFHLEEKRVTNLF